MTKNKWGITYLGHKDSWHVEPINKCPQLNVVYDHLNMWWVFVEHDSWYEAFNLGYELIIEYINIGEN